MKLLYLFLSGCRPVSRAWISQQLTGMEGRIMSKIGDEEAQVAADFAALKDTVGLAITKLQGIPQQVQDAVAKALADAGVDDETQAAALAAVDADVKATTQALTTALSN